MSNTHDCWEAGTSDGRQWHEYDAALQVSDRSPWRALEALCVREGLRILWAQVVLGAHYARMDADGCALTCGETITTVSALSSPAPVWQCETAPDCAACPEPPPPPRGSNRYRWVCRQEPTRRVWTVVWQEQ